jgi:LAO/AO transport system kinase
MSLAQSILEGDRLALARLLTLVENDDPQGLEALDRLYPHAGKAHLVGVTGAPGTGKSSLVNRLAWHYRRTSKPRTVGVVAVDPTSPFSGGAILGDRVRMRDLAGDPGVFIRSMASRGSLGGLAAATSGLVQVLDATGFAIIFIETVGAGQAEVDIAGHAHTTLVVETPGFGDDIQAIKAGILEIADIIVLNKADQPGVENTERALKGMLQLSTGLQINSSDAHHHHEIGAPFNTAETVPGWQVPVCRTVATEGDGIAGLAEGIDRHEVHLHASGLWEQRERRRLQAELEALLQASLVARWRAAISAGRYQEAVEQLMQRQSSPRQIVRTLLQESVS